MILGGGGIYIGWLCPCAVKLIYSDSGACTGSPCWLTSEQQLSVHCEVGIVQDRQRNTSMNQDEC